MHNLWQVLYEHRFAVGGISWYLFSAAVVSLPAEGEPFQFYPWLSRTLHLLLNIKPIPSLKQPNQGANQ